MAPILAKKKCKFLRMRAYPLEKSMEINKHTGMFIPYSRAWISKQEEINTQNNINCKRKTPKKVRKELSTWIVKEEKSDTPETTAIITANLPEFILPNVSVPSQNVIMEIKTSNEQL